MRTHVYIGTHKVAGQDTNLYAFYTISPPERDVDWAGSVDLVRVADMDENYISNKLTRAEEDALLLAIEREYFDFE